MKPEQLFYRLRTNPQIVMWIVVQAFDFGERTLEKRGQQGGFHRRTIANCQNILQYMRVG